MNFFKSAKYKLNGSSSKTKGEKKHEQTERFQKFEAADTLDNKATEAKASSSDVNESDNNGVICCLRIRNKTSFPLKLKETEKKSIFPNEVSDGDSQLVRLRNDQAAVQAVYMVEIKSKEEGTKMCEFKIEIINNVDAYEFIVDWMNLSELEGIQLTPVSASFAHPVKLGKDEELVEIAYNQ